MIEEMVMQTPQEEVEASAATAQRMIDDIVAKYSGDLDSLMQDLLAAVTAAEAISTPTAERYYAELTNMLYFMVPKVESLNVYNDISKAVAKEAYNKYYLKACADKDEKGKAIRTVAENTAMAEVASSYNMTLSSIYEHAYKTLKFKVDTASEMVSTLKNILKHRVQEEYLSATASNAAVEVSAESLTDYSTEN